MWKQLGFGIMVVTHLYAFLYLIVKTLNGGLNPSCFDEALNNINSTFQYQPNQQCPPSLNNLTNTTTTIPYFAHQYTLCTKMWQPECSFPYDHNWDFRMFASGFDCMNPTWCDTYYAMEETINTQTYFYDLQHPATCDRMAVINSEYWYGLGADLHIKSQIWNVPLTENRTAMISSGSKWLWADMPECGSLRGFTDCWFQPFTSCNADQVNTNNAPAWNGFGKDTNSSVLTVDIGHVFGDKFNRVSYVPPMFAHKDYYWWHAQTMKYITRPNQRTINMVLETQKQVFGGDGVVPHPIISLYVRHGDKWQEAALKSVKEHMDTVMPTADKHNIQHLYIGTDDPKAIDELKRDYGHRFKIYYIDTQRFNESNTKVSPMDLVRQNPLENLRVSLSDLYIQIQGDVFVGTRSSNWCRLIDELRKVNGKARIPYFSPENPIQDNKKRRK